MMRKLTALFLGMILALSGCEKKETNSDFKMSVLDVGKGDAIVLQCGNEVMVVDTGYEETYTVIDEYLQEQNIEVIDYLIITHYDKDHVGGALQLLNDYEIKSVYLPDYEADSKRYRNFKQALANKNVATNIVEDKANLKLGDASVEIIGTSIVYDGTNDNNVSLALSINYGEHSFLLAGDAEKKRLDELSDLLTQTYDVYKVPHHGRIEKNSESFISNIEPKYAIITCDEEGPEDELLAALKANNVVVYTSAKQGTITIFSDGKYKLEVQGN